MAQPTFTAPLPLFLDLNGNGLNAGKVYIGVVGQDPIAFPQTCYFDAAGTVIASQPIRTMAGYVSNAGAVAQLYGPTNYSIIVKDSNDVTVYPLSNVSNSLAGPLALSANGLTVGATQLVCSGGFVGFGTATPGSAADVAGTLRVTNPAVPAQYVALSVAGGLFSLIPSAGVTNVRWQSDALGIWNTAGTVQFAGFQASGLIINGAISDVSGNVRGVPKSDIAGNFTLSLAQLGYKIKLTNAGAQTVTIPTNAAVAFGTDAIVTLVNRGTTAVSITPAGGVTLIQAATGATGTRTLAVNGLATLIKNDTDEWMITGSGVS